MTDDHPQRAEMLALLGRADCHYGNTLRDEEAGWSVERAARDPPRRSGIGPPMSLASKTNLPG